MELSPVKITSDAVYIGGQKLPDYIEESGVTVIPSARGINRLTVTFIVGEVHIDDPISHQENNAR